MTTQLWSIKSPDTATTLTQGTDFYLDAIEPGLSQQIKTTAKRKSYVPITKFDKGGEFVWTLSGKCTTYAQYAALMAIITWPAQANYGTSAFITLKELYSTAVFGGANVSRSWSCMLAGLRLPMAFKSGEPVEGCKFSLALKVVSVYVNGTS